MEKPISFTELFINGDFPTNYRFNENEIYELLQHLFDIHKKSLQYQSNFHTIFEFAEVSPFKFKEVIEKEEGCTTIRLEKVGPNNVEKLNEYVLHQATSYKKYTYKFQSYDPLAKHHHYQNIFKNEHLNELYNIPHERCMLIINLISVHHKVDFHETIRALNPECILILMATNYDNNVHYLHYTPQEIIDELPYTITKMQVGIVPEVYNTAFLLIKNNNGVSSVKYHSDPFRKRRDDRIAEEKMDVEK